MKVPKYNGKVLEWARTRRGLSPEDAAAELGTKRTAKDIVDWEHNIGGPTVPQARKLADLYGRSFLEFFLPEPPALSPAKALPDFRMRAGFDPPPDSIEVRDIQDWVAAQRVNALDLYEELAEPPVEIPLGLFTNTAANPETAGVNARAAIGFLVAEQFGIESGKDYLLPEIIRKKLESIGILTFRVNRLDAFAIRGICIAEFPLPVVVFTKESPAAQAFTLAHELAHVLIRESGITGPRNQVFREQPIERWCDRFAASFLMPAEEMVRFLGEKPRTPDLAIDDARLTTVAKAFRVSPHAMLIRLVHLGYVRPSYYWEVKKGEFEEEEKDFKRFGRAKYYGTRFRASLGDLYTKLVIGAWESGRITNHNAAEYMGIKNLKHLNDIRDRMLST